MSARQTPAEPAGVLSYLEQELKRHLDGRKPHTILIIGEHPRQREAFIDDRTRTKLEEAGVRILLCRADQAAEQVRRHCDPTPQDLDDIPQQGILIVEDGGIITVAALQ